MLYGGEACGFYKFEKFDKFQYRVLNNKNWSSHIRNNLESSNNIVNFFLKRKCEIDNIMEALKQQFIAKCKQTMLKEKLRTFAAFRKYFSTEYVC